MKAKRQHKEATSRVIQSSKGYKKYMIDNRPLSACQVGFRNNIVQKKLISEKSEGYKGNADELLSKLWNDIETTMSADDHIVEMVKKNDIKVKVSDEPSTQGSGRYDPTEKKITLNPNEILITHENRERLYDQKEKPQYGELRMMHVKANFGMIRLSTVLYHELGHYYQDNILGINLNSMCEKNSGRFLFELHNILQSENRMAVQKGEPLRSSYRSMGSLRSNEIEQVAKGGMFALDEKRDAVKTTSIPDDYLDIETSARIKKIVSDYAGSLQKWMDEQPKDKIKPDNRVNVERILTDSLKVVDENTLRRSQVYLLQGIIDSAYFYLKDLMGQ